MDKSEILSRLNGLSARQRQAVLRKLAADGIDIGVHFIPPRDRSLPDVLSYAQQRLWFIAQLEGGAEAYHIPCVLRMEGELDRSALQRALDMILQRHEVLSTVYVTMAGTAVPVVDDNARFSLTLFDLSEQVANQRETEVQRHVAEEVGARFDLSTGPVIRGRLLKLRGDEHVLLITMHHIASDGWSLGVLIREVGASYEACLNGRPDPLAPLPIQYADYARWQQESLQGAMLEQDVEYWKQQLADAPALLELPRDRPRPAVQSYRGDAVQFVLDAELSSQLRELARRHEATLFMILYAGFAILMSRLSAQQDVVIGAPVANRQWREVEELIGFFVNTLALRARFDEPLTVDAFLAQVKETTLGAFSRQDVPFERVVEAVQAARSSAYSPLFQVLFGFQTTLEGGVQLPGLKLTPQQAPYETAQFDLKMAMRETRDRIVGSLNYASALFDRSTVERWVDHYQAVLRALTRDAQQRVSALSLLTARDREQILESFNGNATIQPGSRCLHVLFDEQVRRTPDAVAICHENEHLTYAALGRRADQLARYLRGHGVGPEQRVAVCLERGLEMVVALLGISKSGGAYAPLEVSSANQRLAYMLADVGATVVLTQARIKPALPTARARIVCLDSEWDEVAAYNGDVEARVEPTPQNLAYVIYTSGSTGQPKAVMVEHRQIVSLVSSMQRQFMLSAADRVAQFQAVAFDPSIQEILTTLLTGATLVVRTNEWLVGAEKLGALCDSHQITVINLPASLWRQHVRSGKFRPPSCLRLVLMGGERADPSAVATWFQGGAAMPVLLNGYGPTETTITATVDCIQRVAGTYSSIGRPIANTRIYILDRQGEPAAIGVVGEIHIGGAGVARGYLNQAALTAERFVDDPFSPVPQARMYKTGDLGRWRPDGSIEYLGRNDNQVKINGFRVELGEIEAVLMLHPQVKEAVVLARADASEEKRLLAYVTAKERAPTREELKAHVGSRLPGYMVPVAFVTLSALPLTVNDKIDLDALPQPEFLGAAMSYEPPAGEIEVTLANLWAELLGVQRVGRNDSFFDLGGHSILAVQMIARVQEIFGVEMPLASVFQSSTVALVADAIAAGALSKADPMDVERLSAEINEYSREKLERLLMEESAGAVAVPAAAMHRETGGAEPSVRSS